jgi:acyl-CoA thioester hydrolase
MNIGWEAAEPEGSGAAALLDFGAGVLRIGRAPRASGAFRQEVPVKEPDQRFRFRHPVDVRFKDVDVGGHAHHSHALVYFEEARWAYWRTVLGGIDPTAVDYILAEASVRYHRRVFWPQRLDVGVRVSRLGKKHFEMAYQVLSPEGEALISGTTVQVWFDYQAARTSRIPDAVVEAIRTWEDIGGSEASN